MSLNPKPFTFTNLRGYTQKVRSVLPGSTIDLRVSSGPDYSVTAIKPGPNVNQPSDFDALPWDVIGHVSPAQQAVTPGSYVDITNIINEGSPPVPFQQFTLECWVRPWVTLTPNAWYGLIDQYNFPTQCGFGLFIDDSSGKVGFYLGDGGGWNPGLLNVSAVTLPVPPLLAPQNPWPWAHVVGTWDGANKRLYVNGILTDTWPYPGPFHPGTADLLLAAYGENNFADHMLNGDLAMPVVYSRALSTLEVQARFASNGRKLTPPYLPDPSILGIWPFDEEIGATVADHSGNLRTGTIVNQATWMIGGPNFNADWDLIPTIDLCKRLSPYVPFDDSSTFNNAPYNTPPRGHSLRFAADDIYDCRWTTTDSIQVPDNAKPGLYAALLTSTNQTELPYYIPFIVRSNADTKPSLVVLCSTNTWNAYRDIQYDYLIPLPGAGGSFSMYRHHDAGMCAYQLGLRIPNPIGGPYFPYPIWVENIQDYYALARAERFLHIWLEQCAYDFDVIGDVDLHVDSSLLDSSQTLVINGHSEYWSDEAYAVVKNHLDNGGKIIVMSGNTMFWRVSYDLDLTIMECRKYPAGHNDNAPSIAPITNWMGSSATHIGEIWHSHDQQRGGLRRETSRPLWALTGMECVGFDGFDPLGGSYNVTNQTHPLFTGPFNLHLSAGDTLGLAQGQNMSGGCVNHEYDITAHSLPIPVAPLACGSNPTPAPDVLANCGLSGGAFDFFINADNPPTVVSEISYWARPAGGTIFTVGAIAAGQGLAFDPKMLMLLMNVLSTFSVKRKEVSVSSIAFSSTQNNVVAIQKDGTMLNKWFDGSNWNPSGTGWQSLGNPALRVYFQGMPFITHNSHRINILALGTDRHIYNSYSSGAAWSSWQDLGGDFLISGDPSSPQTSDVILHPGIAISPVMVYFGNDEAWVFAIGIDGVLYGRYWNGSVWSSHTDTPLPSIINWYNLGGAFFSHPVAAMYAGMITVIAIRNDGILASRYWDGVAWHNSWTNEVVPDVQFLGSPAAIVSNPPGTSWLNVAMTALDGHIYFIRKNGNYWDAGVQDLGGNFDLSPAIIWSQNRLNIMVIGKDGHLYNKWSYDGTTWSTGWQDLGGTFRGVPSIEESLPDQIEIFVVGTDNAVYHKKWDGTQWIPSGTNWDNFGGTTGN